ncbi:transcription initiation factor TFIID 23-30kDa subunit-domain-containing protein [Paraphysoderma sedebokerense]|nr:transcription initiation factor TFIID 23-30kDa subunit-domain-containing protein [Paraphysoderma sedebokerense]
MSSASSSAAMDVDPSAPPSSSTAARVSNGKSPKQPRIPKVDEDFVRKEKSLAEFLTLMDEYQPIIPDAVTDYYLTRSGLDCDDVRIKRLLALAAQKFVADIAADAMHFCKLRNQATQGRRPTKHKKISSCDGRSVVCAGGVRSEC